MKPCPFCRGTDLQIFPTQVDEGERYIVGCECGATGPLAVSAQKAIDLWNGAPR